MTGVLTVPVGLRGINAFSTPEWWSHAVSVPGSGSARSRSVDRPGPAVVLTPDQPSDADPPVVLMITEPLVDWLPIAVPDDATADPARELAEWADAVLAWAAVAPVHMVITRTAPDGVSDLRVAASGRWAVADSDDHDLPATAAAFGAAMRDLLPDRRSSLADLDRFRSRAAIDTVAYAADPASGAYGDAVRAASLDVRKRLISAGVRIHGPRTGLIWPQVLEPDVPLDVAAEASLAVIFAALDDPSGATGDWSDAQAIAVQRWRSRRQAAADDLKRRREDPRNLKRIPVRRLLKVMLLGRRGG